jgi:phage tail-like protein
VSQVEATTAARSYIDHLPAVYAREDQADDFLRRWLALFRAELGDAETLLDEMARRFDPAMAPRDHLAWLAGWLAFQLPNREAPRWSIGWLRELILKAQDIYTRRGTKTGLREAIERHTGLRVEIIEAYRERRIWQLGFTSRLGFDTGLPAARADGAVVPDSGETLVVGEFIVDQSGPQQQSDLGAPLFDETAHLFSVVLPAGRCLDEEGRARLRGIVDAEKPAHTDYHLCLIEPRMRIGFQARIGVDSIVAGPREPLALNASRLGLDAFVAGSCRDSGARLGYRSSIGQTMRVG